MDTKLETGPGVWELRAHNQARGAAHKTISTTKAIPSPTHMLFVKLQQVRIWHNLYMFILLHHTGRNSEMCG